MPREEVYRMLESARDFGIRVYNAWAAEPLLREDLPQILGYAKELGMLTSLVTNGKLLDERLGDLENLDYLSVSVDGIDSHKEIRGFKLEEILPGIKEARDRMRNPVLLNCVISGKNLGELEDLVYLAEDLGVKVSFEPLYEFQDIEKRVWRDMGIRDTGEYRRTIDHLIRMKRDGYPIINSTTYLQMVRDLRSDHNCHTTDIILHVGSDGAIQHCRVKNERMGDVRDGIEIVWRESRDKRRGTVGECEGCLFFGYTENSLLYEFKPEVIKNYEWM